LAANSDKWWFKNTNRTGPSLLQKVKLAKRHETDPSTVVIGAHSAYKPVPREECLNPTLKMQYLAQFIKKMPDTAQGYRYLGRFYQQPFN